MVEPRLQFLSALHQPHSPLQPFAPQASLCQAWPRVPQVWPWLSAAGASPSPSRQPPQMLTPCLGLEGRPGWTLVMTPSAFTSFVGKESTGKALWLDA